MFKVSSPFIYPFTKHLQLFVCLFVIFSFDVQARNDTITVSSLASENLETFLENIAKKTPVQFYYKSGWFDNETTGVTLNNLPLEEALDKIFSGKPFVYEFIGNAIVFLPREDVERIQGNLKNAKNEQGDINTLVIGNPNEAGKYNQVVLSGRITDGKNGEPLLGATVVIENTIEGTITNTEGRYRLNLQPGYYKIAFSSIGFEKTTREIKIISHGKLDIQLFEKTISLDEISVYARKIDRNVSRNQMSIVEIDAKTIKQIPVLTGEKDLLKGLTLMPGVKSVGEFGSGINVRGGGEDQNLYLLEEAPLFNTSHVFGLLSVINPDAVDGITLYKGHIPAGYGERVSSVMKIDLKDNHIDKIQSRGGIGIYNSRLMVQMPLIQNKLSLRIGGRTSYSDWLLKQIDDYYLQNSSASFHDINGTINWNGKKDHIHLSGYSSKDNFSYASALAYGYSNTAGSLKWTHLFNNSISSSLITSYSQYRVNKDEIENEFYKKRIASSINYMSAKLNLSYNPTGNHEIDAGIKAIGYQITPGNQSPLEENTLINEIQLENEQAVEWAGYLNDIYTINKNISVNMGLRYSLYQYLGPKTIYHYQDNEPLSAISIRDTMRHTGNENITAYQGLEPRLSLKVQFTEKNSIKLSYNRNFQYISLLSYTSISTPDDRWKLADPYIEPISANQFAIGYYHNFFDNRLETSVEVYYKDLDNLSEYKNNASLVMNHHIETELIEAKGKNYGIEFYLKKNFGKIDGWLSYTWSRSFRKTNGKTKDEQVNDNKLFPSSYDKPHDLSVIATYHANKRVRLSGNFSFSSGRAVTLPEYQYPSGRNMIIYYSDRNKYRLPPYHRLDLSLSIDESLRKAKKWKGSWTFSLLNVYARKNAYSVFYKKENPTYINDYRWFSLYKMYLIGIPLPTVTYNFIF